MDDVLRSINLKEALIYSVQLLSAVHYLQNNNYLHRDIKPGNVFLDNSNVVLADFGLIKKNGEVDEHDEDYIRDAMPLRYKTPQLVEYLESGKLSMKSDIFQLGLVLYEIFNKEIAMKQPPNKESKIVTKSFNKLKKVKSQKYGERIDQLLLSMISLDEDNIKSTGELLDGFQKILEDYLKDIRKIEFKVIL